MRAICLLLAAAFALSACPAGAEDDPFALLFGDVPDVSVEDRPGEDDVRLVTARLGDLKLAQTLTAYARPEGLCVVAADLFEALESGLQVDAEGARGAFPSPSRTLEIDAAAQRARVAGRSEVDLAGQLFETPEGWCLVEEAWARLLPLSVGYDAARLTLQIDPRETLPIEARLARQALREQIAPRQGAGPDYPKLARPAAWLSWPTIDVALDFRARKGGAMEPLAQIDLAGDLAFATGRLRTAPAGDGGAGVRFALERTFEAGDAPWGASQVRVGDIAGLSQPLIAAATAGRGAAVSNRPAYVARVFDITDIRGPLPAGWEAELYRDGQLVAYQTEPNAQGNYVFANVEIRPGYNRFRVQLFGPYGEREERPVTFFAGADMHPENELQYEIAILEEGRSIDGGALEVPLKTLAARVSYGVSRFATLHLDAKASASGALAGGVSLAAVRGETHGVIRLASRGAGQTASEIGLARQFANRAALDLRYAFNAGLDPISAGAPPEAMRQRARATYDTTVPVLRHGLPVRARIDWEQQRSGATRLRAALRMGASQYGWRWTHTSTLEQRWDDLGAGDPRFDGRLDVSRTVSGVRLRGGVTYGALPGLGVQAAEVSAQRRWSQTGFGQLTLSRDMAEGRTQASASVSRAFGPVAVSATSGIDDRGAWTTGLRLAAALFRDPRAGRFQIAPPGLAQTGAVRAHVFDDLDGDGVMGPGDTPIEQASFIIDQSSRPEATGPGGQVTVAGLPAHRYLDLQLALGSLEDPFLQPAQPGWAVKTRPGQVLDVDVALTLSGEADATLVVVRNGRRVPVAGVTVQAVDQGGQVVAETLSEYDGYVYFGRLPMGEVALRVAPRALAEIGALADPAVIHLSRTSPAAFGQVLEVYPAQTVAALPIQGVDADQ
ncbi:MAG: hypothetical protein AAGH87_04670 [Pseudomonadota bacterium]